MRSRYIITSILLLAALVLNAADLNFGHRRAATVGICVVDLNSGQITKSENIDVAMIPASILKCLTTASALNILGDDFRFKTETTLEGIISGKTLNGNLVIHSSGDPTIDSRHFKNQANLANEIAEALRREGIDTITGSIKIEEDWFPDYGTNPQWVIEDQDYSYGTGLYGFNWYDNTYKEPIDYPADEFIEQLSKRLKTGGVVILGNEDNSSAAPLAITTLTTHASPTSAEIMQSLMHRSDNMMAEAMLRAIAPGQSRSDAIKKELAHWTNRGVATTYAKIADGSGLARMDRVNARFMADLLTNMARSAKADTYVSFFPRVGKDGTVKNLLSKTRLDGKMALKSGSMNGVQCFAGYKLGDDGKPTHAIVLMVNNFYCSRDELRKSIEQWLLNTF